MGLKVDAQALPPSLRAKLRAGKVNLDDPATTLALLKLNSVVGVTGLFDKAGRITSLVFSFNRLSISLVGLK